MFTYTDWFFIQNFLQIFCPYNWKSRRIRTFVLRYILNQQLALTLVLTKLLRLPVTISSRPKSEAPRQTPKQHTFGRAAFPLTANSAGTYRKQRTCNKAGVRVTQGKFVRPRTLDPLSRPSGEIAWTSHQASASWENGRLNLEGSPLQMVATRRKQRCQVVFVTSWRRDGAK